MRKEEFVIEYERRTDNSKEIFAGLKEAGYTLLGGGQDATVWGRDEGEVLKVIMPSENKEQAEASFMYFFKLCKRLRNNPHVPKFFGGEETFEINGTPYLQFGMERLQPIAEGSFEEAAVWLLSDMATTLIKWKYLVKELPKTNWFNGYRGEGTGPEMTEKFIEVMQDPVAYASYEKLLKTMQYFWVNGRKQGLGWDLHTENVMQRADGTLVITDPYFNS